MQEHLETMKHRAFVSPGKQEIEEDEMRLKLIRELSAEYIVAMERLQMKIDGGVMARKPNVKLPGKVEKVIESAYEPEKAEISIEGADPLYREIRIENSLKDESGREVRLEENDQVDVTVESEETEETRPIRKSA